MNCFTCPKTHNSNNYKNGGERADGTTDNLVEFSKIAKPATTNGSNNPPARAQ
uniref:LD45273p n=1 Tax=Drosophila melanogaster TaxID=7227 RepID=Q95SY1_DROME|nr:LD45273p [Drosophila melanogaster]